METLSVDTKFMQKGFADFKYLLVATYDIVNFVLAITIKYRVALVVAEVLAHQVMCIFSSLKLLIIDKDSAFMQEVF